MSFKFKKTQTDDLAVLRKERKILSFNMNEFLEKH